MLPVGDASSHGSGDQLSTASNKRKIEHVRSQLPKQSPPGKETSGVREVVGSAAALVEPSWDVDHDYSSRVHHMQQDSSERLTPAEEELITQLTSALEEVSNPVQGAKDMPTIEVTASETVKDPISTPDIVQEFFDFGMDAGIFEEEKSPVPCEEMAKSPVKTETTKEDGLRISSPVRKDQIMDYLQDQVPGTSPRSVFGSESGYDSSSSPRYFASDDEQNIDFDMDSFSELFPSLF